MPNHLDVVDRHRPVEVVTVDTDLCDACSGTGAKVAAYVYAELPSGRSLAYCGSHATRYWTELNRQASTVIDLRHLITR